MKRVYLFAIALSISAFTIGCEGSRDEKTNKDNGSGTTGSSEAETDHTATTNDSIQATQGSESMGPSGSGAPTGSTGH